MVTFSSCQMALFATATLSFGLLFFTLHTVLQRDQLPSMESTPTIHEKHNTTTSINRKLLHNVEEATAAAMEPNRIGGQTCSMSDLVVNQGPGAPLPNGIPTYLVHITNICPSGCEISGIHLSCGWFASARLINPKVFKRLRFDDCLVNDGKPLVAGGGPSFLYANSFSYPLAVSSFLC